MATGSCVDSVTARYSQWLALLLVILALASVPSKAMDPAWANAGKILRVSMDGEEAGFDPQAVNDTYSFTVVSAIF